MISSNGELDLKTALPLPGSDYEGVADAMGPLWSMKPCGNLKDLHEFRFQVADITKPIKFEARLWNSNATLLAENSLYRHFLAPDVERIALDGADGLHGTVFLPKSVSEPLPLIGIIDGGIVRRGHLKEERAALFAAKGFATVVIGFYGIGDLPSAYRYE